MTRPSRKIFRVRVSGTPGNGIPLHLRPVQPRGGKVGGTALGYFLGSEREVNIIVRSCLRSAFINAETEIRDLQPGFPTPVETIRPQIGKEHSSATDIHGPSGWNLVTRTPHVKLSRVR